MKIYKCNSNGEEVPMIKIVQKYLDVLGWGIGKRFEIKLATEKEIHLKRLD
jgi:hypothetical protein